jgi:hypothetical protein
MTVTKKSLIEQFFLFLKPKCELDHVRILYTYHAAELGYRILLLCYSWHKNGKLCSEIIVF